MVRDETGVRRYPGGLAHYRPLFERWFMQELVDKGELAPLWRERLVPGDNDTVFADHYADRETAVAAANALNPSLRQTLAALTAERAKIANGFGLSASAHWGKTKAAIRQILLPRANQLLQLASVQRMLAEALARGERVLISNGIVFWYEPDGDIGWQVKETLSTRESEGATI